jgi:hypothetical protein
MKVEEFAHVVYRYRTTRNIVGDEHGDKEIAREFLEHMKRGDTRTFDKFIVDKFKEQT